MLLLNASGCLDALTAPDVARMFDAFVTKTVTPEPREGNAPVRIAEIAPRAQLAWEAPMACGYGACYGCAIEIDGELRRLCVEGPVLEAA